jgi:hypothetical protein
MKAWDLCSEHFIFFETYESAQQARLLHNIKPDRLASDKHSDFFGLFISYKK